MAKLPSGAAVDIFDTLDSTSLEAKRRAATTSLLTSPQWFVALKQTAGYGRRGRAWEQDAGDFAGTLLFRPDEPPERLGQISFVAALAVASALDEYVSAAKVVFKWPNDILANGGKIAGILLERVASAGAPLVTVGIGVNIVSKPRGVAYPTTRLVDIAGAVPSPEDLAARIDRHFWVFFSEWKTRGFAEIRRLWLERAQGVGREVTVRLPNEEIGGVFEGLDETGALILRLDAGKRIISAGEVFFGA